MELEKLILEYAINGIQRINTCETVMVLEMCLKLVNGLDAWDAKKAIAVLLGGESIAE